MKHILHFLGACTAFLPLFGCQPQTLEAPQQTLLTVFAETEDAKTYLQDKTLVWGENEYLQLWYNDGADKFSKSLDASANSAKGKTGAAFQFSISPA
ncbi:MAG: hypothetical protein J5871_06630, partial [Bacteroidales bacterium]|nr:hypothetical protein [Bacteroidales bacterium]